MRHILVGAGQSNMEGRDATPQTYANADRIYVWTQHWDSVRQIPVNWSNPGAGSWVLASSLSPSIHANPVAGVGPMQAMADQYLTLKGDPTLDVGIVPCGWQGTGLILDGGWLPAYRQWNAWSSCVARTQAARAACGGSVKAFVYQQGEYEAQLPPYPLYWIEGVQKVIQAFRCEVGDLTIPAIAVGLGPNPDPIAWPSWNSVQSWSAAMVGASPKLGVVSAADLTMIPTSLNHLTAASNVTVGHRAANCLYAMQ